MQTRRASSQSIASQYRACTVARLPAGARCGGGAGRMRAPLLGVLPGVFPGLGIVLSILGIKQQALLARRTGAPVGVGRLRRLRLRWGGAGSRGRRLVLELEAVHAARQIDLEPWPLGDVLAARDDDVVSHQHAVGLDIEDR